MWTVVGADPCVEPRGGDVPWAALGRRPARLLLGAGQECFPTGLRVPLAHTGGYPSGATSGGGGGFVVTTLCFLV